MNKEDFFSCKILPFIISSSFEYTLCVWRMRKPSDKQLAYRLYGHKGRIFGLCKSSKDSRIILSSGEDKTIKIWKF